MEYTLTILAAIITLISVTYIVIRYKPDNYCEVISECLYMYSTYIWITFLMDDLTNLII